MDKKVRNIEIKMEFKNEFKEKCALLSGCNSQNNVKAKTAGTKIYTWLIKGSVASCGKDLGKRNHRPWCDPSEIVKGFIMACIPGVDSMDNVVLMSFFNNVLSDCEQLTVYRTIQGTLEDNERDNLLELF